MQLNDTNKIQLLLNNAVKNQTLSTAMIGDYVLDNEVNFPENVTLILDRVNLTVKNNGKFIAKNVKNIKIIAINNTTIDFTSANVDNTFIDFENVQNFEISGLNFINFKNSISLKSSFGGKITNLIYN